MNLFRGQLYAGRNFKGAMFAGRIGEVLLPYIRESTHDLRQKPLHVRAFPTRSRKRREEEFISLSM